jgi:hypothetical protein
MSGYDKGLARSVATRQLGMKELYLGVVVNGGVPSVFGLDASEIGEVIDNGVGDYTLVFKTPPAYGNIFAVNLTPIGANLNVVQDAATTNSITINVFNRLTGVAADGNFYITIGNHENNYVF